jgi:hypothetical protein
MARSGDWERERLFFEHDLATPFTNLRGAHFLLGLAHKDPPADVRESMDILQGNIHILEKMLGWFWRTREVSATIEAVEPWPATEMNDDLADRLREAELSFPPPWGEPGPGMLTIPREPLEIGLIGAAITLRSASGTLPDWTLEGAEGLCVARFSLEGDENLLDAERLFRKYYWPGHRRCEGWFDPGLPYLEAVLKPFGGGLELAFKDRRWCLECAIPTLP